MPGSHVRLLGGAGGREESCATLAEICCRITEGVDTGELGRPKALQDAPTIEPVVDLPTVFGPGSGRE